jgi:hypothetical protein
MPKIAVYRFFTFYILVYDVLREPPHLHVAKEKGNKQRSAKIWLNTLEIVERGSFSDDELNTVLNLMKSNKIKLIKAFKMASEGKKIRTIDLERNEA